MQQVHDLMQRRTSEKKTKTLLTNVVPNQDIRDNPLPSQETGICEILQECVADDKDKGTIRMSRTVRAIT